MAAAACAPEALVVAARVTAAALAIELAAACEDSTRLTPDIGRLIGAFLVE
jgi:hypothetical protein